ncbi:formylmethanofuran dehydrogenase [Methylibium sp.]|uniref:formylmethanofuran dehydrogenase n=1 Tax=Methylibium sp. TaxID=2067992 RepID=UPI002DBB44B1|nr:formylmethanofuran dehydrogenase [Methylibium sp.]
MAAPAALSTASVSAVGASPWTCPFCTLLCDGFALAPADAATGAPMRLLGSDCPIAQSALARFSAPSVAACRIGDEATSLDAAIEAAAQKLAAARQPVVGGLGLDVAGARALYPLACASGAVLDGGTSMLHGLRALQDRGQFTATFAEVRNRADLVVCLGPTPRDAHPEIWRRLGFGEALVASREIVFLGAAADPALAGVPNTRVSAIASDGDAFDAVSRLAACVAGRRIEAGAELVALAGRLRAARYVVLTWNSAGLPAHGSLIVEAANAIVAELNRTTRAAVLALGSGAPLSSQQTVTWLSGLPLRSRAGPLGLEHEPLRFDAKAMLAAGDADALLWIASFGNEYELPPVPNGLPLVVIGHAQMRPPAEAVFIPVATPGLDDSGDLFRVDGSVTLPLAPVALPARDRKLPGAAEVLKRLAARVQSLKGGAR